MCWWVSWVTLKRGAVKSRSDHLPLLAGQQAGHFLGALLSQIGNIPLPDEQLTNLANSANSCHLEQQLTTRPALLARHGPDCFPKLRPRSSKSGPDGHGLLVRGWR